MVDFRYTTLQLDAGFRSTLHVDAANVGKSMTTALGPFLMGNLWQADGTSEGVIVPSPKASASPDEEKYSIDVNKLRLAHQKKDKQ